MLDIKLAKLVWVDMSDQSCKFDIAYFDCGLIVGMDRHVVGQRIICHNTESYFRMTH